MAVISRMGFPPGTGEDEAREQAITHVRDVLGDDDPLQSAEVTDGDDEVIVKVITGPDTEPQPVPQAAAVPPEHHELAARAREFLAAYDKQIGAAL